MGNDRKVEGINHDSLEEQLNTLTKDLNNPQIINPPFTLVPEMPYIEGTKRISLRDTIFREVACNLLVHREFSNGHKASLTIFSDRVETRNWNLPHQIGRISPENLSPQPKNRAIANVFTQMGLVEELGSGTRKMFKYCPLMLPGSVPVLDEDDVFTAIIPISLPTVSAQSDLSDNLSDSLSDNQRKVLQMIIRNNNVTAPEMAEALSISRNTVNTAVARLKALGIVKRIGGAFGGHWEIIAPNGSAAETKS